MCVRDSHCHRVRAHFQSNMYIYIYIYITLRYVTLRYVIILYYIILYYIILYYIILYYIIIKSDMYFENILSPHSCALKSPEIF